MLGNRRMRLSLLKIYLLCKEKEKYGTKHYADTGSSPVSSQLIKTFKLFPMDFLIAIFGGLAMATVMCLLYNKYGAKGVISLVTILIIICGVLVHQAGGNMTVFFLLLVPMVIIRLSRSLLLMNLLFIGLFFGSCSTSKLIEPTEPTETVTTFNYSQVFKAKLVAQG